MPLPADAAPVGPVAGAPVSLPPDAVPAAPATATPIASALPSDAVPVSAAPTKPDYPLGNPLGPDAPDQTDWKQKIALAVERASNDPVGAMADSVAVFAKKAGLSDVTSQNAGRFVASLIDSLGPLGQEFAGSGEAARLLGDAKPRAKLPADAAPLELTPAMEVKAAAEASKAAAAKIPEDAVPVNAPPPPTTAPQTLPELQADVQARGNNAYTISPERQAFLVQNSSEAGKGAAKALEGIAPDLTQPIVKETLSRDITNAIGDVLEAGQVKMVPGIKITDQVMDLLQTDILDPEVFSGILKKHGITPEKFLDEVSQGSLGQSMRESARLSGQTLQQLSALEKIRVRLQNAEIAQNGELSGFLRENGTNDLGVGVRSTTARVGNLWRSTLVSQLATSMRNAITAVGTAGVDTLARTFELGLRDIFVNPMRRLMGKDEVIDPIGAFTNWANMIHSKRSYEVTKAITDAYPRIRAGLFSSYASDVSRVSGNKGVLGRLETVTNAINFHGKLQEYFFRRAFFSAELERRMAARGQNLYRMVEENRLSEIHPEDMQAAVGEALRLTFGRPLGYSLFDRYMRAFNTVQSLGGKLPFPPFPFVRFMADAMKWQFEHSPLGPLALMSKAERASLTTERSLKIASRALAGTTLVYAGYLFRNSPMAGPNWYDVKTGDGRTIDTRAFNPLAGYWFMGDLIKRQMEGTLLGIDAKQLGQGLVGANFRSGSGLFLIDQLMAHLSGVDNERKIGEIIKGYAGETLAGFLTPFQQLRDAAAIFDPNERIVRDTRSEPFLGPIKSRIPYVDQLSEPMRKPTRAGPTERQAPLLRMLTGLSINQPTNAAEDELTRLGFQRREILPPSGDIPYDIALTKKMGPLVEKIIGRVVESPNYQALTTKQKSFVVSRLLTAIRGRSLKEIKTESPDLAVRRMYERIPKRQRMMIEEMLQQRGSTLKPSELGDK